MNDESSTVSDAETSAPSGTEQDFAAQAEAPSRNFVVELISEFRSFLVEEKKWWLIPIIVCLVLIGLIAVLLNSPAAPFIYPMF